MYLLIQIISMTVFTPTLTWAAGESTPDPAAIEYTEPRIEPLDILLDIPATSLATLKYSFTKESIPAWTAIILSTAITYHYDEDIYAGGQKNGRDWGLGNEDKTKTVLYGFGFDLVRLPSDTGSALYFLGDGWTHFGIAGGFLANGLLTDNNRSFNTALQIVHGMFVSTMFSQALKRSTGRESPNRATSPRGRWRPFPSVKAYQQKTAEYDAFPSGHVMTATLVFTTISNNYPEYSKYIIPFEVLWVSALSFQMVNNGVHWASDYPLGIGIGYAVAKMSMNLGKQKHSTTKHGSAKETPWLMFAGVQADTPTLNAIYSF